MNNPVVNIILFFGVGLSLPFFIKVDAEVFTILSAAAIAGLLTYMSVFISERNADIEKKKTMIKEMKDLNWDYIELVNDFVARSKTYKDLKDELLEELSIYKKNYDSFGYNIFTNMGYYVNSGYDEKSRNKRYLKEIGDLNRDRNEYRLKTKIDHNKIVEVIREKTDFFLSLKIRAATKGERLVDVCMIYGYSYLNEEDKDFYKPIRDSLIFINDSIDDIWRSINKKSSYEFDMDLIESIERKKSQIRLHLANLEAESEKLKEASEIKRKIYLSVLGTIFICLGYVISQGYA
ncbi:hypothetical protein SAMN04487958_1197 [Vreelandella subterranea]|uniref:Uncharacterized protein n=1 Tax=Vreelandella subterranea TaxID=416874 RepID=A0A1H9WR06_9GAMM|nr:hypothetical protein [Halomonas subterranea]SES35823.1 hypothetical protein SAMN04487958_1197 [Halomonas subterranea]